MARLKRLEPYWYAIGLFIIIAGALFIYHLATGNTPPRAALTIFGFPIYWYGIWIVTGVALGAWVASRLAAGRAEGVFTDSVPAAIRDLSLDDAGFSQPLVAELSARNFSTLGRVLWEFGLDPRRLGLKKPKQEAVREELLALDGVENRWIEDAPWRQWNPDHVWNALIIILVLALIGARLYHILTPSPSMAAVGIFSPLDYFRNPYQLLNFRGGGLGIYGAIVGGLLGLLIYTRRNRLSTLGWADLAVVGLALGQAVGRWGNFFNQELYGRPTDLPWAITIDPIYRLPDYVQFEWFHPAFLYESLWSMMTFFVLYWLARRRSDRLLPGEIMALYFIAYAVGRSLLELVRLDSRSLPLFGLETGIAVATLVSLVVAIIAFVWIVIRRLAHRRPSRVPDDQTLNVG
ncbi:MAG: prolipoprotein diacylglyceryl transferase [Chloroflexota bacterium]|jgi:phosphatidylglycerol---prolipoprotein diacylglyceryl transferase